MVIEGIPPYATVTDVKPAYEVTVDTFGQIPYRVGYVPRVGDLVCVNPVTRVIQHSLEECECPWNAEFKAKKFGLTPVAEDGVVDVGQRVDTEYRPPADDWNDQS